jgi:predicted GNAT superfamily acetyltransferase
MADPKSAPDITIRNISSIDEYRACVRLEHEVWGKEIAVPSDLFAVAGQTGGQTIAAFAGPDQTVVGFVLALVGRKGMQPYLHSHMAAVLPEYQNHGIGRTLKLFQREEALRQGIRLIEWTFDPLQIKNAHFNLMRLGAIVRRFKPNFYGITASPLHAGLPTDRLVAEWWLDSQRAEAIAVDKPVALSEIAGRVSLPSNIAQLKATDQVAAEQVQSEARKQFIEAFDAGLVATAVESHGNRTDYLFERADAVPGLKLF